MLINRAFGPLNQQLARGFAPLTPPPQCGGILRQDLDMSERRQLSYLLAARISPEAGRALHVAAKAAGVTLGHHVRSILAVAVDGVPTEEPRRSRVRPPRPEFVRDLLAARGDLGRATGALLIAARAAETTGSHAGEIEARDAAQVAREAALATAAAVRRICASLDE